MRSIAIWSIGSAVAFAALGFGMLVWWYGLSEYRPVYKAAPPHVSEFVRSTGDMEHLRKFALLQVQQHNDLAQGANEIVETAINMIIFLALSCAVLSVLGWLSALKAYRLGQGTPMPRWLRWL